MAANHGRFSTLAPPCRERLPVHRRRRAGRGGPAAQRAPRGGGVHSPVAPGRRLPDRGQPLAPPAPARHSDPLRGDRRQRLLALPRGSGPARRWAGSTPPRRGWPARHRRAGPSRRCGSTPTAGRCWPSARSGRCATRTDSCCWTWTGPCGRSRRSPSRPTPTAASTCACRSTSTSAPRWSPPPGTTTAPPSSRPPPGWTCRCRWSTAAAARAKSRSAPASRCATIPPTPATPPAGGSTVSTASIRRRPSPAPSSCRQVRPCACATA